MAESLQHTLETFFTQYPKFSYPARHCIWRSDQKPTQVHFLQLGTVKQVFNAPDGRELTVNYFKPGTFFPLTVTLAQLTNRHDWITASPCEGWRAPAEAVNNFIRENPAVHWDLTTRLLRGADGLLQRIEHVAASSARLRVLHTLLIHAKRFAPDEPRVTLSLTHRELAEYAGLTRETVSRELAQLVAQGVIENKQLRITLPSVARVEQLVSASDEDAINEEA